MIDRLARSTPWIWIALVGLVVLTLTDIWRDAGVSRFSILQGSLPNFVAVPVLVFGFLMLRFPERRRFDPDIERLQDRSFGILLAAVSAALVIWEFLQLTGNLRFDVLDLVATGLGAMLCLALFRWFRSYLFFREREGA